MTAGSIIVGTVVALAVTAIWRFVDSRYLHTLNFLDGHPSRTFNDEMLAGIVGIIAAAAALGAYRLALFAAVGAAALVLTLRVMKSA